MGRTDYDQNINKIYSELIVTADDLKAYSLLDFNIDDQKIIPYILEAQRLYLEPMIGTPFYRKLQDVSNRGYVYDYLVTNYVTHALVSWALGVYIKKAPYQIAEGGVFKHYSTDSELAGANEVRTMAKEEHYKAQDYAWRMAQFIETYKDSYPEWSAVAYEGIKARQSVNHLGGWVMNTNCGIGNRRDTYGTGFGNGQGNGPWGSMCNDLTKDPNFFIADFFAGNNNETDMGFNPASLPQFNTIPNQVWAQPIANYFWMVSDKDFIITTLGTPIPLGEFGTTTAPEETYVKGEQDGYFWIRITIADTYEVPVQFNIQTI